MALCLELQDLRKELFSSSLGSSKWLISIVGSKYYGTIKKIAKYMKLGMTIRRFLRWGRGLEVFYFSFLYQWSPFMQSI